MDIPLFSVTRDFALVIFTAHIRLQKRRQTDDSCGIIVHPKTLGTVSANLSLYFVISSNNNIVLLVFVFP